MAGTFAQSNIAGYHRLEHPPFKVGSDLTCNLVTEIVPAVEHGKQDTFNTQARIERPLYQLNGPQQLTQPLHGVVLTLQGYYHCQGGCQGINGKQSKRRWAVQNDVVILRDHAAEAMT